LAQFGVLRRDKDRGDTCGEEGEVESISEKQSKIEEYCNIMNEMIPTIW
jgi:hypothetical protein